MISAGTFVRRVAAAATLSAGLVFATTAMTAEFETPPTYDPGVLLGERATGANYQIANPVSSDGFLRIYALETPYGEFRAEGDFFLQMRLNELAAISALAAAEETETFQKSFQEALKAPVDFVGEAIDDPGGTLERTISGVGRFFDRAASAVRNRGQSDDNVAESLLGISRAKREIAVGLGVDPYTDFKPLADSPDKAAQVSAAGKLTVKGLFALIPGGAGMAVSAASTAGNIKNLVRDKTASELLDINRSNLVSAVGEKPSIQLFLDNANYTLTDQTIVADALYRLRTVTNVDGYLARAAGISERGLAVFMRERAVLLAQYHEQVSPLSEFVTINGFPLSTTGDGKLVGVFPIDDLAWTERTAGVINLITEGASLGDQTQSAEFLITGAATPLAQEELQRLGWTLTEQKMKPQ